MSNRAAEPEISSRAWRRLIQDFWANKISRLLAVAIVVLLIALVSMVGVNAVNYNEAIVAQNQRDTLQSSAAALNSDIVDLEAEVERYKPAWIDSQRVEARTKALEIRSADVAQMEADMVTATAELDAREGSLKAREDAIAALANSTDWWIEQIRECLARPGSYRMASATEGALGRDVSCMSG
ncbi:hypothetical protein AB0N73_04020 [Microbacterium sp. NPDC089189]|uniref:hypothetical protein n=1 Tax=Microbacterium sp. NPDC089189 TaxID=3154972 RepID=UPI0034191A09